MPWVHASVGALLGGLSGSRGKAFTAGALSHGVCDLVPHRDFDLPEEVPMLLGVLLGIAARFGVFSPEMIGAVGAVAPDVENGLERLGIVKEMFYPTHTSRRWYVGHGRPIRSPWSQVVLAAVCLIAAHLLAKRRKE